MCPFEMVGLVKRYFCAECASRCGTPFRNLALIALVRDAIGIA